MFQNALLQSQLAERDAVIAKMNEESAMVKEAVSRESQQSGELNVQFEHLQHELHVEKEQRESLVRKLDRI